MNLTAQTKLEELQGKLYAKAKAESDFRFYALYDKMYRWDVLQDAWRRTKGNRGAAGVDGQTFDDIEAYGEERWLRELQQELQHKTYKPQAVKRVFIPKADGLGERPLGIPTIRDRVAQRAALLLLEPIFEADLEDSAFGYRPTRSGQQAVSRVQQELRRGKTCVVDADLSKFFDTVPHADLMKSIGRRVVDTAMLHLIKMWLKVPVEERDDRGKPRMTGGKKSKVGTPQGGVISPLLANVYMNRLLRVFSSSALARYYEGVIVNYADDFVIAARHGAAEILAQVRLWLTTMKLTLNEEKTCLRDARTESFCFLGYEIGPQVNRQTGQVYLGSQPSAKAVKRLREKVSRILQRERTEPWPVLVAELNQSLVGWGAYYNFGYPQTAYHRINEHVAESTQLPPEAPPRTEGHRAICVG